MYETVFPEKITCETGKTTVRSITTLAKYSGKIFSTITKLEDINKFAKKYAPTAENLSNQQKALNLWYVGLGLIVDPSSAISNVYGGKLNVENNSGTYEGLIDAGGIASTQRGFLSNYQYFYGKAGEFLIDYGCLFIP